MNTYKVTVKYQPKSILDTGKETFRITAIDEIDAKIITKKHTFFPIGGEITKVKCMPNKRK